MESGWDIDVASGAKIEFDNPVYDYGTVNYGGDEIAVFGFINTGNAPLIITKAIGSAGFVKPSWPKEPIAPGARGTIIVRYDMKRSGPITKGVTVSSNAVNEPNKVLRLKGMVSPQAE